MTNDIGWYGASVTDAADKVCDRRGHVLCARDAELEQAGLKSPRANLAKYGRI